MHLSIACSWLSRLRGLLPDGGHLGPSGILMLVPCHGIHTFGMRVPIDVAFLDRDGYVCRTYVNLPPGRHLSDARACAVLERVTPDCLLGVEGEVPEGAPGTDGSWFHPGEHVVLAPETPSCAGAGIPQGTDDVSRWVPDGRSFGGGDDTAALPGEGTDAAASFREEIDTANPPREGNRSTPPTRGWVMPS